MKLVSLVSLLTAVLVSAETQQDISWQESEAWHGCTQSLVDEFDQGKTGDVPACNLWGCLHKQASHYGRGGTITTMSNLLSPACVAARLSSGGLFGKPKPGPPASYPSCWRGTTA
ncbi:hypothetical protein LEL_08454 [Akanthomyces lecanii RCEF 1005]|uniref:Uncharacterized protein n=1 Tax=Akanthomyces lecanii RCEF 1005 TaxID=1081108 RepID=A0A168DIZ7_CORDF|nr:hypothetical protein LEL_08454 [Akanthomyces lecanii RCEF 1005]